MTGKQARRRQLLRTIGLRFSGMDVLKALGLYLVAVMCCLLLRRGRRLHGRRGLKSR